MVTKICNKCNEEKPDNETNFYATYNKDKTKKLNPDGTIKTEPKCKVCKNKEATIRAKNKKLKTETVSPEHKTPEPIPDKPETKCSCCFTPDEIKRLKRVISINDTNIDKTNRKVKAFNINADLLELIKAHSVSSGKNESDLLNIILNDYFTNGH
jgi:hypothetical protein